MQPLRNATSLERIMIGESIDFWKKNIEGASYMTPQEKMEFVLMDLASKLYTDELPKPIESANLKDRKPIMLWARYESLPHDWYIGYFDESCGWVEHMEGLKLHSVTHWRDTPKKPYQCPLK